MISFPIHREYSIYQTSTITALLAGDYDGDVTVAQLLRHGDFGIGTFNHLDGEMVVLNGHCYQLHSDGTAREARRNDLTPYAAVTRFRPDLTLVLGRPQTRSQLTTQMDRVIGNDNTSAAVKIRGVFTSIRTRTVARQEKPYTPLTEATSDQKVNVFSEISGTIVGFRTPGFEQSISVPGYHLHFIDDEKKVGGHVLDFNIEHAHAEIATINELHLSMPKTEAYRDIDMDHLDVASAEKQTEG